MLDRLPTARLVLKAHQFEDAETAERVRGAFGSAAARVETRGSSGHRAFMAQYNDIDIALDTFPYNGATTTLSCVRAPSRTSPSSPCENENWRT